MKRREGIIFENKPPEKGWDGDSGVGQAPEFPSQPLKINPPKPSKKDQQRVILVCPESKSDPGPASRQAGALSDQLARMTKNWIRIFGNLLILIAVCAFLFTYWPVLKVELGYRINKYFPKEVAQNRDLEQIVNNDLLGDPGGIPDAAFSLIIPNIHARSRIVANVDPSNKDQYMAALKLGIAHAKGSRFPGEVGNIYLFAHSTDTPLNAIKYNAIFYLLKELVPGDEVSVYFLSVKHDYRVTETKIIEPTDTTYLSPENPNKKEQLILQTCWPPGTSLKRLLVIAEKI